LFRPQAQDIGAMATALGMERGLLQYHLDQLLKYSLADIVYANYMHGKKDWGLTLKVIGA
jgi:hypothetical protein